MHCTFCRLEIKWIRNQRQELLNYNSLENTFWSSCWLCQEKLNKLLSPALYYLHRSGCSYNIPIEKKSWAPLLGYLFLTTFSERSRWWIECNRRSNDAQWRSLCSLSLIISIDSQFLDWGRKRRLYKNYNVHRFFSRGGGHKKEDAWTFGFLL